MADMI